MNRTSWKIPGLAMVLALALVGGTAAQQQQQQHPPGRSQAPKEQLADTGSGAPERP